MKQIRLLFIALSLPLTAMASHIWSDIDLCEVHKDKLPPGLTFEDLPEAHSPGAKLLGQYCTQCHNLPGPDRHTSTEWRDVTKKMFMLMDVSHRFGGLMGKVEIMQQQEQDSLLAYLQGHAVQSADLEESADGDRPNNSWVRRILVIAPFLLLTGLGLLRWSRTGS